MAGKERGGFTSATDSLYVGASMILTPDKRTDMLLLETLKHFFLDLGFANLTFSDPEEHDRIIAFTSQDPKNYGVTVTHKIRSLTTNENGEPGFITYGTTTDTDDEAIVTYPYVQGKYVMALPKVGTFFTFLRTPQGYILFILIPFLLLIMYQGVNCVKAFRAYKAEQMAQLKREKAAIAAERRRSAMMMRQLQEMQKQMQAQQAAQMQQTAPPVQPVQPAAAPEKKHDDVDIESMMAELAALRAQLAEKNENNT